MSIKRQEAAVRLPCPVCGQSCRAEVVLKHKEEVGLPQSSQEPEIAAIHSALSAANIPYTGLSFGNGLNLIGDSKSIMAAKEAFHSHGQIGELKTQIRHWREECGKFHAKLTQSDTRPDRGGQ